MHFHLPKPLHGWREFAGEVGVIVLGVLIALGAQQVVEAIHARRQGAQAQDRIQRELLSNAAIEIERLEVGNCLSQRLSALAAALASGNNDWSGFVLPQSRQTPTTALREIYHTPAREWVTDAYREATSQGDLATIDATRRGRLASIYNQIADLAETNRNEDQMKTDLAPLQFNRPLSDPERNAILRTIAQLDMANRNMVRMAQQNLRGMRLLGLRVSRETIRGLPYEVAWGDELNGGPRIRSFYGNCIDPSAVAAFDPSLGQGVRKRTPR